MRKSHIVLAGTFAGWLLSISTAGAETIAIGACMPPSCATITQLSTNNGSIDSFSGAFADFTLSVTGQGPANPVNLDSTTVYFANASGAPTSLDVFVTETGVTGPVAAALGFLSSFTQNLLTSGWSVTEATFLDSGNTAFALTTPLSSASFTTSDLTQIGTAVANTGSGPYSVTEEFAITTGGVLGNTNDTIDLTATPLPGALALFAGGLSLLGVAGLRKRRQRLNLPYTPATA